MKGPFDLFDGVMKYMVMEDMLFQLLRMKLQDATMLIKMLQFS